MAALMTIDLRLAVEEGLLTVEVSVVSIGQSYGQPSAWSTLLTELGKLTDYLAHPYIPFWAYKKVLQPPVLDSVLAEVVSEILCIMGFDDLGKVHPAFLTVSQQGIHMISVGKKQCHEWGIP